MSNFKVIAVDDLIPLQEWQAQYEEYRSYLEAHLVRVELGYIDSMVIQASSSDGASITNFRLRELVSEIAFRILLFIQMQSRTFVFFWPSVHRQLICFGRFLKGRTACI